MKKMIKNLCIFASLCIVLTACSGNESKNTSSDGGPSSSNSSSEKTVVKVLSLGGTWEELLEPIILEFEKENPNIEIQTDYYPFDQLFQLIEVKFGSGSKDYDVFTVDVPMVAAYTERGYLSPLDDYFTSDELTEFIPSAVEAGTWRQQFMAAPMNTSSQLLFYNKEHLDAAGIPYPSENIDERLTWEEVIEMATKAQKAVDPDRTKGIAGLMFEQVSRPYQMLSLPNGLGAPSIGSDGLTVEGIINSPEWVKALEMYQETFENGISLRGMTPEETSPNFMAGKTTFFVGGTWNVNNAKNAGFEAMGYAPHPYFEGQNPATPTGSWHYGMTANSDNKDEAATFIKYMTLGKGNTMWLEANNDVPATQVAIESILNNPENDSFPNSALKIAAFEAANTAVPRPVTPGFSEYDTIITQTFEDIRNGADVKTALDSAVNQLNTVMKKYKK